MMKIKILGAAVCALLAVNAAFAVESSPAALPQAKASRLGAQIDQAFVAARGPHPNAIALRDTLETAVADPAFPELDVNRRHSVYLVLGTLYSALHNDGRALESYRSATMLSVAGAYDWAMRLRAGYLSRNYSDAADCLIKIASRWPAEVSNLTDDAILAMAEETATDPDTSRNTALLEVLFAMNWHPKSPFINPSSLWLPLAKARLRKNDLPGAVAAADRLENSAYVIELVSDKEFDPVIAAAKHPYDAVEAAHVWLAKVQAASATAGKLEGVNRVGDALLAQGRGTEALQIVDNALARGKAGYSDFDVQLNWTLDERSRALFYLGRIDEGFAALRSGAGMKESGGRNVSQAINLADYCLAYNRPRDALEAVSSVAFGQATPYGQMALVAAKARAYFALGDTAHLADMMTFLKGHSLDGALPYRQTLAVIGDSDALALEIIRELNSPTERSGILLALQDYQTDPFPEPTYAAWHANWQAAVARPDVQAVLSRVGRTAHYALFNSDY